LFGKKSLKTEAESKINHRKIKKSWQSTCLLKSEISRGKAQDKQHKDKIDVIAWSWGVSNSGSTHTGQGSGAGKANVQDLTFTKWMDKSSTPILLACCNGKHFAEASLIIRKAGEKPVEYCKITMEQVLISSVSTGGSGHDERLTEHVTLNFGKVSVDYTPQNEKGAAETAIPMSWDIAANTQG
jgi:type VI secretion system secreted protein Hcp